MMHEVGPGGAVVEDAVKPDEDFVVVGAPAGVAGGRKAVFPVFGALIGQDFPAALRRGLEPVVDAICLGRRRGGVETQVDVAHHTDRF